jgi:cell division protein FtsQ
VSEIKRTYKANKRKLYATIFVVAVAIISIIALTRKKSSVIKDYVIEIKHLSDGENDLIKEKDVKEIIRRSFEENLDDQRVGQVNVQRVERVVEADPFVENAETFVDVNNNLHITITQREPICRIIDNNGLNYYMDKNGVRLPLSKYFSVRVPIITGAVPPHVPDFLTRKKYGLKDVFTLVTKLRSDDFFNTFVQQIYLDAGGEFTLIPVLGEQKIRIGTLEDLDEKLQRLHIFYNEAMPYEGWKKYKTISVKYKGQIVCKKR